MYMRQYAENELDNHEAVSEIPQMKQQLTNIRGTPVKHMCSMIIIIIISISAV